jgi:hypothetical protein
MSSASEALRLDCSLGVTALFDKAINGESILLRTEEILNNPYGDQDGRVRGHLIEIMSFYIEMECRDPEGLKTLVYLEDIRIHAYAAYLWARQGDHTEYMNYDEFVTKLQHLCDEIDRQIIAVLDTRDAFMDEYFSSPLATKD